MKVGLYIGHTAPTDGGGHTFILELLGAMERVAERCGHELVICHYDCAAVAELFPKLPAIDLKRRKFEVLSWFERLFEPLPEFFQKAYRRLFGLKGKPRWDDRVYEEEAVQFLVRMSAWGAMTHEIPFAAISFDLAHRNWPCFPEVGAYSMWLKRQQAAPLWVGRASIVYTGNKRGRWELEFFFQVPPEHIRVLPYPTPSFAVAASYLPARPELLRRLDVPRDYLFYPAQFWAHKNHVVVLEACKIVRERSGWDLGIVFTGSDKGNLPYVRDYARRLGIESACRFLDFVAQDELVELYKAAFCLTYATFFGPDNLPPLEAFALGCPVIASAVPGSEEQLGEAALLFAPQDEQELARHILSLRDPATRARYIAKGQERTRTAETWDGYAKGVISSLDDFAGVRRAWP